MSLPFPRMKMYRVAHTWELQGHSPPLSCCVTLGKSLHLFEPQFPHLETEASQVATRMKKRADMRTA